MYGTIAINLWMGFIAFLVTFFSALTGNIYLVSLVRAVCAFLIFFLIAYPIRWVFQMVLSSSDVGHLPAKGQKIDLATPDEPEASSDDSGDGKQSDFVPLNPPRLYRKTDQDPKEIAELVRHRLSED
jgi:hypothetical protein